MLPFNVNAKEKVTRQKVSNIYSNRVVNGSTYKSQAYIIKSLDKYLYYTKATYLGIDDFYYTYQAMLLSYDMACSSDKDLSRVKYSPATKVLYKYKGNM